MKKIIGIYSRVSSTASLKGLSLQDQVNRGIEQANQLGWEYEIFKEGALTGTLSYTERPQLNNLVNKILSNEIHGLFCVDLDRLSRDVNDGQYLISFLIENKTRLFDVKGEIDIQDENQELISRIRNIFSALERKKIYLRMKRGKDIATKMGRVKGGHLLPYGYKKGDNKMLVIDRTEAKVVKRVFDLALSGKGTKVISNILNDDDIPTKRMSVDNGAMKVRGDKKQEFKWRDTTIYQMLTNTIYKGERRYNDNEIAESPVIIDPVKFDTVQELLKTRNTFKNTTNKHNYLLKGLMHCECGYKYQGRFSANKIHAYYCGSYRYKGEKCGMPAMEIEYIEKLIWSQLLTLDEQVKQYYEWSAPMRIADLRDKRKIHQGITERENNLKNILKAIEKGGDFDLLNDRLLSNKKELEELKLKQVELDEGLELLKKEDEIIAMIKGHLRGHLKFNFDQRLQVVRALIEKINVKESGVEIEYKINALTNVKLGNDIDITSKLLQHYRRDRTVTQKSLVIKQNSQGVTRLLIK